MPARATSTERSRRYDSPIRAQRAQATREALTAAAAELFTLDALYRETPHAEPLRGRTAIAGYWATVTADQADIEFDFAILAVTGRTGIAEWSARFRSVSGNVPVELNGIFVLDFAPDGDVESLREWWHAQ